MITVLFMIDKITSVYITQVARVPSSYKISSSVLKTTTTFHSAAVSIRLSRIASWPIRVLDEKIM
jgi:hypothetical protein